MATCAVSTSAQSNLCSRCWCLEQPVLIHLCAGNLCSAVLVATCAASTSARSNLCSGCWCLKQPVLITLCAGDLCSAASMATCAVSASAQSNLCSGCWYLEQPVLITPMRRQPVLGYACGNLCRFDLCAEHPVLWLLVLRATCAHDTYARQPVLGCVYGYLCRFDFCAEQPVLSLLVLRATCAHSTYAPATCARTCLWQPVPLRPLRRATCALAAGA